MKVDIETEKNIKHYFDQIKDINGLLNLINAVNKTVYHNPNPLKVQNLTYHAFKNNKKYKTFLVQKKSGGTRMINAPVGGLKHIQTSLNIILQSIYKPQMTAHGFRRNRSVVTNAQQHVGKNYVYNIDLKDFFSSIHKARIEKKLQTPPFNLNGTRAEIATLISRIVTQKVFEYTDKSINEKVLIPNEMMSELLLPKNKNYLQKLKDDIDFNAYKKFAILPQGAPTSPILSNLICDRLDKRLMGLAKRFNVKYTRYADDITFSSMHNVYQDNSEFIIEMRKIISDQNFMINPKKTRLQKSGYKQEVTGLIVNDKVNVNRRYIKQLRAMLYSIEKFGLEKAQENFIKNYKDDKGHVKDGAPEILNVLSGKLNYLKMVKGVDDSTYKKLKERFDLIMYPKKQELLDIPAKEFLDLTLETEEEQTAKKTTLSSKKVKKSQTCEVHNPQKLVKILSSFTQNNNTLKYTTHSWDWGQIEDKFESYDAFMKEIKKEWKKIGNDLYNVAPKLYAKVYGFLISDNLGEKNKKNNINTWGKHRMSFGWGSLALKEWCTNEKNLPFAYVLDDKYQKEVNKKSINRFGNVVEVFKDEIEIQTKDNQLKKLLMKMAKQVLGYDFKVKYINLEGIDFYTDVQWFEIGLNGIFNEIKKRTSHPSISIEAIKNIEEGFVEINIIQEESIPNKEVDEMKREINDGDFGEIKKAFCSLCDWSIEAKFVDGNYKIFYLSSDDGSGESKPLEYEPVGFTHILRFYR